MANKREKTRAPKPRTPSQHTKTVLLFLLIALLCTGAFAASYLCSLDIASKLDPQKIYGVAQSTLVYDKDGNVAANIHGTEDRVWLSLDQIPENMKNAVIAAEDVRFYSHNGVDVKRIFGALWQDLKAGSLDQGASTLTQQLIKNSMLSREKTFSRKIEEALLSIELERRYTKDEILEMYLNYNYFGAGAYGIEAAAQTYFGVSARALSLDQCALLAGILKSSANYAPHRKPENALKRRNLVLSQMEKYGYITAEQAANAKAQPLTLHMAQQTNAYGWYVDQSLEEAAEKLGISYDDLHKGGYRIYTAMDSKLQAAAEALFSEEANFPKAAKDGTLPQAALCVVRPGTGQICAMVGGRKYEVQRGLNRAANVRRQPGSVTKPLIVYAPALESGLYTAASVLNDEPMDFDGYKPKNFGNKYYGKVTLRTAVAKSLNVPAVSIVNTLGVETVQAFAQKAGLPLTDSDAGLSMALGGLKSGFSPMEIASGYAMVADGGMYHAPHTVLRIENSAGTLLYQAEETGTRAMSQDNSFILTDILRSTVEEGTGKKLAVLHVPLAGKTGTNDYEGVGNRDIWCAAYNPDFAAVVWMGYDETDKAHCLPASATGGSYPAKLLQVLYAAYYEGQTGPWFAQPPTVEKVNFVKSALNKGETVLAKETDDKDVYSEYIAQKQAAAMKQTTYGAAVLQFSVACNAEGKPVLTFLPSSAIARYQVIRQTGQTETVLDTLSYAMQISYTDRTAPMEQPVQYYIRPVDSEGRPTGTPSQRLYIRPMVPQP